VFSIKVCFSGEKACTVAKLFESFAEVTQQKELYCVVLTTPWEKSRNPHRTPNCIDKFVSVMRHVDGLDVNSKGLIELLDALFADSVNGAGLGLALNDEQMGGTSCCVSSLNLGRHGFNLDFDFRFPKGLCIEDIRTRLHNLSRKFEVDFIEQQYLPLSYLSPESELIRTLGKAYSEVTGKEAQYVSKGGASYARALSNGVAFGPTFPGDVTHVHEPNERLSLGSLKKAITIYVKVLISLQE